MCIRSWNYSIIHNFSFCLFIQGLSSLQTTNVYKLKYDIGTETRSIDRSEVVQKFPPGHRNPQDDCHRSAGGPRNNFKNNSSDFKACRFGISIFVCWSLQHFFIYIYIYMYYVRSTFITYIYIYACTYSKMKFS